MLSQNFVQVQELQDVILTATTRSVTCRLKQLVTMTSIVIMQQDLWGWDYQSFSMPLGLKFCNQNLSPIQWAYFFRFGYYTWQILVLTSFPGIFGHLILIVSKFDLIKTQKTNIIRDYLEDINEIPKSRMFWPRDIWSKYVNRLEVFLSLCFFVKTCYGSLKASHIAYTLCLCLLV